MFQMAQATLLVTLEARRASKKTSRKRQAKNSEVEPTAKRALVEDNDNDNEIGGGDDDDDTRDSDGDDGDDDDEDNMFGDLQMLEEAISRTTTTTTPEIRVSSRPQRHRRQVINEDFFTTDCMDFTQYS